jgi:8-oxo-dGTP pyrophosphatase MutT (NUDIX family)
MLKYPDIASANSAITLIFRKDEKVAFLLRTNTSWMNNHYGLPGGRVEEAEKFTDAAVREAKEEVGVDIDPADLKLALTWQAHYDDGDWIQVVFEAAKWQGELFNAEPDVHGELQWFDLDALPENVLRENKFILENINAGNNFAEFGWN